MDPNRIDIAGLPTTFAIIGAVFLIVYTLRYFAKKNPELVERAKDATPWMGWSEPEQQLISTRRPINRHTNRWK